MKRCFTSGFYAPQPIKDDMAINQDLIGYMAAALTTASFLPQAIMTIKTRDTSSLSLSMYGLFTLGVLCWLIYGIHLTDYAIIFSNAITLLLASCILSFKLYHTYCKKP
jgi:MtN3 and saliva related transmembrane protein